MPFVFTALVPHAPASLDSLAGTQVALLKKTREAMTKLSFEIYAAKPDVLLVLSPHGKILEDAVSINTAPEFEGNLETFGDHGTRCVYPGAVGFAHQIKEPLETRYHIALIHEPVLDYGTTIPLLHLLRDNRIPLVPIYPSLRSLDEHFAIGTELQETILKTNKRIAIVVTGDLAHHHHADAQKKKRKGETSEAARLFDTRIQALLVKRDSEALLAIPGEEMVASGSCLFRPLALFLGIVRHINFTVETLAYEIAQDVGYVTMYFQLL
ncbi:MAG: hypothetical protein COT39_02760 [Parcubacteria group bacterium CG08_land_8_20_14_0_20_48_21]|nr:MAG: hypothetical protein AUK21_02880 [Parcubacteria group bacterium CG2_30_48_51]PIS32753.1 MAG: hypothetical protein COT39_02760 [Parcubacteria group bacterium CG08_land_8_20_14_0_20_48_21]PIW79126.1 MAG: hypothetical protein COZ99_02475 [Parcubacteria group bacterium CG_4_8_14_3_um_filter_48_16]PIY77774.1 MAG: hypothetical protein COY83_03140 [Parcubacteria group bacterium CG_4_10_14_0_8_um_filter_48_154]PIZ78012.1 MAG: hypothetical protein COY03_00970 [bacterium CG_4_10_14_0_2_um_filter_